MEDQNKEVVEIEFETNKDGIWASGEYKGVTINGYGTTNEEVIEDIKGLLEGIRDLNPVLEDMVVDNIEFKLVPIKEDN